MRGQGVKALTGLRPAQVNANLAHLVAERLRKMPEWCNGHHKNHELASWVKWLDEHTRLNHRAIEAYLGTPRGFVYHVLVMGSYRNAPAIMPPALPPKPTAGADSPAQPRGN